MGGCGAASAGATTVGRVRLTEFHEMVRDEFGQMHGDALLRDHVLLELGGRTAAEAIEAGQEPREVWRALCEEFDVPPARR